MFSLPRILSSVVDRHTEPAQQSELVREAIAAYEAERTQASQDEQILPNLVRTILGREVDYITFIPGCADPVAIVNGLIFRGEAENAYDLKNGWLCVQTVKGGWRGVHSFQHLGEVAKQHRLAMVAP
jgi:hypothetical protein